MGDQVSLADRLRYTAYPGVLVNGKIDVDFSGGDLTVSILTADGDTPSSSNPVYYTCGTKIVCLDQALTLTRSSGTLNTGDGYWTTSWLHLSRGPISGFETDLFVYVGWHGTSNQPMLLVSREGWRSRNKFQNEGSGHGALWSIATGAGGPAESGDPIAVCGRFNAILTTPNTWSAPNTPVIIQRPTATSRMLPYAPGWADGKGGTIATVSCDAWVHNYEGAWLNIRGSIYLDYQSATTISNYFYVWTPLSPQAYTMFGIRPAGAIAYGAYAGGTTYTQYDAIYIHTATNRIRIQHVDRATMFTGDVYVSLNYREYMGGTEEGWDDDVT